MSYTLEYHKDVKKADLPKIPRNMRDRIRRAIEERLLSDPLSYSIPLRKSLRGYRKLRVGDYRVVFRIQDMAIIILIIGHRKEVYQKSSIRSSQ